MPQDYQGDPKATQVLGVPAKARLTKIGDVLLNSGRDRKWLLACSQHSNVTGYSYWVILLRIPKEIVTAAAERLGRKVQASAFSEHQISFSIPAGLLETYVGKDDAGHPMEHYLISLDGTKASWPDVIRAAVPKDLLTQCYVDLVFDAKGALIGADFGYYEVATTPKAASKQE